jgi:phospholipase D1/2
VKDEFSSGREGAREVKEVLAAVRGMLVEMPLDFLKEEDVAEEGVALNAFTETLYT